jgi:hypothetical protein
MRWLASGDVSGLMLHLRASGDVLPLGEVARLVAGAARLAGFDDLAQAAAAVASDEDGAGTQDPLALYGFCYACIERGACHLAVRPLARALEPAADAGPVLSELVGALEHDGQHARAVAVLEKHQSVLTWLSPSGADWAEARKSAGLVTSSHEDMHAGELETSILLHIAPEVVRNGFDTADWLANDRRHLLTTGMGAYTRSGVIGRPSLASADKGKALLASLVVSFASVLEMLQGRPG